MSKVYQWFYNGVAIGGATSKTHTLTSGQTDSNLIECRVQVDYGTDSVAALAEYAASAGSPNPQAILENTTTQTAYTTAAWTPPAGSNRAVFLCLAVSYDSADGTNSTVGTVTWGGNAGTKVAELVVTGTGATAAIYRWLESEFPATGSTFTINISAQQTQFRGMTAVAYMEPGINQTTPVDATNTQTQADQSSLTLTQSNGIHLGFSSAAQNTTSAGTISVSGGVSPSLLLSGESGSGGFNHRSWALVRDVPGATGTNTIIITRSGGAWWTTVDASASLEANPA